MIPIRAATPQDAEAIAAIYAPFVADTVITFETTPPDTAEMERRIVACLKTHPWLVAQDGDRVIGYAYAGRHGSRAAYDWSAEISAYLHPDYHRRGIGSRLYAALIDLLRRQGYHALFAGITMPNAASLGIHTALGMTPVGTYRETGFKFGRWCDVMWLGMTISDSAPPKSPPIPFAALSRPLADADPA